MLIFRDVLAVFVLFAVLPKCNALEFTEFTDEVALLFEHTTLINQKDLDPLITTEDATNHPNADMLEETTTSKCLN